MERQQHWQENTTTEGSRTVGVWIFVRSPRGATVFFFFFQKAHLVLHPEQTCTSESPSYRKTWLVYASTRNQGTRRWRDGNAALPEQGHANVRMLFSFHSLPLWLLSETNTCLVQQAPPACPQYTEQCQATHWQQYDSNRWILEPMSLKTYVFSFQKWDVAYHERAFIERPNTQRPRS